MKRWAIITISLYAVALLLLTLPAMLLLAVKYSTPNAKWFIDPPLIEWFEIYAHWGYWLWLAVLATAQALLLLVPVDLSQKRQPSRRSLATPVITAAFLLANLFLAGAFSILCAFFGDNASVVVESPAALTEDSLRALPFTGGFVNSLTGTFGADVFAVMTLLGMLIVLWLIWGLIFYHYAQSDEPRGLLQRATHWLVRASILELLVAVPSHIIVRQRGDCCAPFATFWGIVTGISVMLLSFGPGVFFLFARRMRRLRPAGNLGPTNLPPSR